MTEPILKDEVFRIVGCAFEVYNEMGCGFLEPVYQEAMELELADCGIAFERQKPTPIFYKSRQLTRSYIADLIVIGQVVVELKAEKQLMTRDEAQLIHYLQGHPTARRPFDELRRPSQTGMEATYQLTRTHRP